MISQVKAIQRGLSSEVNLQGSRDGALSIEQFLPKYTRIVAAGKVFAFNTAGGTAIAPVTAVPTTTASWGLYNSNSTKYLVLLMVAFASVSGTLGLGAAIIGTVAIGDQTQITANYTGTVVGCLDGSAKTPSAFLDNTTTLIGTQSPWVPLATEQHVAAVSVGAGAVAWVDGLMICPPQGIIGLDLVAPTGSTALFDITVVFIETELDLA